MVVATDKKSFRSFTCYLGERRLPFYWPNAEVKVSLRAIRGLKQEQVGSSLISLKLQVVTDVEMECYAVLSSPVPAKAQLQVHLFLFVE